MVIKNKKKRKDLNNKNKDKSYMAKLSQKWLDILIVFSYEYNKNFSGSEISKKIKLPQRSVSRYLVKLVKQGILRFEKKGSNKFYYLDLSDERVGAILNLIESYKSFIFSRNNYLWKEIKDLTSFGTIVLFGSQVKGYSNSSSDIDVLIFSKKSEKLKKVLRTLPKVQAQIISFDSFEKLVYKKDVLALEILKSHVIFGDSNKFINLCRSFYNE